MADPFSIIVGTAGLADVCIRVTRFLKQAKSEFRAVDQELEDLSKEILSLQSANELVRTSYTDGSTTKTDPDHQQILGIHWHTTQSTLSSCQHILEQFEALLREITIIGSGKHVKLDQLRKWLKQQSKEEAFNTLREKLKMHQAALQLSLSAISVLAILACMLSTS